MTVCCQASSCWTFTSSSIGSLSGSRRIRATSADCHSPTKKGCQTSIDLRPVHTFSGNNQLHTPPTTAWACSIARLMLCSVQPR